MTKITRIIKEARDQARLTALDFAQGIFDNFVELHGDRSFRVYRAALTCRIYCFS